MDHLELPSPAVWEARRLWFEKTEEEARGVGNYLVGEQACALSADVQAAFCVGAWAAVIVLACAVIDASLREAEFPGFRGSTQELLKEAGAGGEAQALRARRNRLVHVTPESPGLTVDQQYADRALLEGEARRAVQLMWSLFYLSPWS